MNTINKQYQFSVSPFQYAVFIGIFLVFLLSRLFLRGSLLELDEAEQVILAQQLHPGYANQPPLYSWMQYLIFQMIGVSLFSVALLKSLLLTACVFFYFQISRLHCESKTLAKLTTLSWILIPAISLDLIKDNTHSVMALLMACITWYCFIRYRHLPVLKRSLLFAVVLSGGFLSKFNYLLFLLPLIFCYWQLVTKQERVTLLISLLLGIGFASPYFFWLSHHAEGLQAVSKLVPENKTHLQGLINLAKSLVFFLSPLALLFLFFPFATRQKQSGFASRLLHHYHSAAPVFLVLIAIIGGFRDFETRWLIPIFFLTPLIFFSQLADTRTGLKNKNKFIIFCLLIQSVYFGVLIHRSHHSHQRPPELIAAINQHITADTDWLISESYWLLGNIKLQQQNLKVKAVTSSTPLPQGKLLIVWLASAPPFWVDALMQSWHSKADTYRDNSNQKILAGSVLYSVHQDNGDNSATKAKSAFQAQ